MGEQEDTTFLELQRIWWGGGGAGEEKTHQSLLLHFVINVKQREVAVSF